MFLACGAWFVARVAILIKSSSLVCAIVASSCDAFLLSQTSSLHKHFDVPIRPRIHKPNASQAKPQSAKAYDERRGTAHQRGYGWRWQQARKGWLEAHPLCVECQHDGRIVAATTVDHIVPHKGDMQLFWDSTNWQSLCKTHHDRKTAREDGGFANTRRTNCDGGY